tara:strand:- start:964 stop:1137 length:174 start_codon:yes stop_codon:yes gene_type:complete
MCEDKCQNDSVEFLLKNKKIKHSEINDVKKIYSEIERCNNLLFLKLKKELINKGWIA